MNSVNTGSSTFCRVTVLAPRTRMDVALPTDLTVAELVPMLAELAGETGARSRLTGVRVPTVDEVPSAWCLAAAAGAALPPHATLAGLGVLDGDLLRLRRRDEAPPPPVFDDPVDAVAEVVAHPDGGPGPWSERAEPERADGPDPFSVRPWDQRWRRAAGLTAGALAAVAAAALLAAARGAGEGSNLVATVLGALGSMATLAGGTRLARRDDTAAVLLGFAAVPLAASAGFAALPGVPGAGHLLLASGLAAAAAAAGLALLDTAAPVLVAVVLAAGLTALSALLGVFGIGSTGGLAAGAAATAIGVLPLLPKASIRLAGLPPPVVPTTPDEMVAADAQWEFASTEEIRFRARLAHTYLAGLVLGASVAAAVGAVLAFGTGGWAGTAFAPVVVAVLLLRSRSYVTAAASGAPLVAGLLAGAGLLAALAHGRPIPVLLVGAPTLLLAAGAAVWLVWDGPHREFSPVARRAVDVVEALLVVAAFPLALAVLDLYRIVRSL